jgi:hypothetical protein
MKKFILAAAFILFASIFLNAQEKPYQVVFDLTSGDTIEHRTVIRWMKLITEAHPKAMVELVVYGNALPVYLAGKSVAEKDISSLATLTNVRFRACGMTMKRYNVSPNQLISGIEVVPDAIYEIISKQSEGWGYIKVSH